MTEGARQSQRDVGRSASEAGDRAPARSAIDRLRWLYYAVFLFFTWTTPRIAKRENAAWSACTFITMLEVWSLIGAYNWAQVLFEIRPPPGRPVWVLVAGGLLVVANLRVPVTGAWRDWDRRFHEAAPGQRRTMLIAGGATPAVALALSITSFGPLHGW